MYRPERTRSLSLRKREIDKKPPGKPEGQPLIYSPGIAVPAKNIKI